MCLGLINVCTRKIAGFFYNIAVIIGKAGAEIKDFVCNRSVCLPVQRIDCKGFCSFRNSKRIVDALRFAVERYNYSRIAFAFGRFQLGILPDFFFRNTPTDCVAGY